MNAMKTFLRDTIIGGLFFLTPFLALLMVGQRIWAVSHDLSGNVAKWLGLGQMLNLAGASVLSAVTILLTCFLFGLLARWSLAGRLRSRFESGLKNVFPPYEYYKAIVEQKLSVTEAPVRPVVLVRRPGGWRPGILVEQCSSGERVVFFPFSPRTTDGEVYLVSPEDIRSSTLDERSLQGTLLKQGKGLAQRH